MQCELVVENVFNQIFTKMIQEPTKRNKYELVGIHDGAVDIKHCSSIEDVVLGISCMGIMVNDGTRVEYLTPNYISRISIRKIEQ